VGLPPRPARARGAAPRPDPTDDPWKDYLRPTRRFPRNGVHVHDGTIHVTFVGKTGKEVTWKIDDVRTKLARVDGRIVMRPFVGEFYGGTITADASPEDESVHGAPAHGGHPRRRRRRRSPGARRGSPTP
jgi:hypothetical protein